jgi:2-hydroxychromene-2-carboxylate isomerase
MTNEAPADIEFFWDPICPFAWQTSNWLRRVATLRGLTVEWRLITLSILNEERDYDAEFPDGYQEGHDRGRRMLRVAASVRATEGPAAMERLYEALGRSIWQVVPEPGVDFRQYVATDEHLAGVLESAGFDAAHMAASTDRSWDEALRAETEEAIGRTGPEVGTPILTFGPPDGPSIFGPVISSVPESDEECLELYDTVLALVSNPAFSELKRTNRPSLDLPILTGRAD